MDMSKRVLVPVRYPLTKNSRRTIERAAEMKNSAEENIEFIVLHVNLIQGNSKVTKNELQRGIEKEFGLNATYAVRRGFLVEETILEEAGRKEVDMVLIGKTRSSRLRKVFNRLIDNDPDIETFLEENLDITIEVVE